MSAPLYGASALALVNAWLVQRYLPESLPPGKRSAPPQGGRFNAISQLAAALRERRLRLLFGVVFCFAFGSVVLQSNLAVMLKELLAFGPAAIGFVLAVSA